MEALEEDAPNDRAFPTTGKTLARCASWDGKNLTSRHYRYMSPKKIEKVNYHFFGRLLLFCLFGGYYSYKRPVMVFGVGSNLGLGALGSRLAGRLSPEEERQVAEWGEEWVRGLAEWRDDPWIDVGTSRAEMMCRDALLIPSSFWWCCSFSFRLFLVGLEVQRIHSFMGFQPCPTNIYI